MNKFDKDKFIEYVYSFYGPGGVYDMGATKNEIALATDLHISEGLPDSFCGDSIDRECVRDLIIELTDREFPDG
jgi:hypothetical protein